MNYLNERSYPTASGGCWEWTGNLMAEGYGAGRYSLNGKRYRGHVVGAIISTGRLPNKGEQASHLCHNKSCVNPLHLTFESRSKNMKRSGNVISEAKRNSAKSKEASRNNARNSDRNKLTMEDAREIRRLYATGKYSQRQLAKMFGCSQPQIGNIINNKQWIDHKEEENE